ncbi:probable RNA-binding protein EIF1AD [Tribolium castaneum]|uniref:Probable RNA-binding protein EIF1AD n=1 Tax=Tribolium castaneum TaxID=7070 RepID=D2A2U4_TRICA|nr:PREDICTED: probable RNA-binding protein EIF1AD [Tribolium castaneum]XP_015835129.1 PREDICTED: probable RNA-binding protein EIF1AD [Tribolium castaneum]XP_968962.1 PREDICTED: probable RNA-binding protein EIF1AD [Tribolium castaneum]EFA02783.1 putative RNA-binding protein EIF1AD-like Protein [Tribolium castaneum]|eukprot:XP_008192442.1 PREDICTED: probable RNA-binding protein EIF1AD [Tribolium castaneum]
MSRKTKRKHVFKEALDDDMSLPTENQTIVRIISTKGNNLHEVLAPNQSTYLVSMPTKFRKNIWVKRGSYVLVEPITEGDKVKAEIVRILTNEHIKCLKEDNVWPPEFSDNKKDQEDESDLLVNRNRLEIDEELSSSDSDSEDNK